jgi:DNA polymerase elongation subunit (family B)
LRFYTDISISGNNILVRGVEDGKKIKERIAYKPKLYVHSSDQSSKLKTINGTPVDPLYFNSIFAAKDFIEDSKKVENRLALYGMNTWIYPFIYETYPGEIKFDLNLISIVYIDIEVSSKDGFPNIKEADKEVTAITVSKNGKRFVLGCHDYKPKRSDVHYTKCENESDLLTKFVGLWQVLDPDIVTGWNCISFDILYLYNRLQRIFGESAARKLSPWGKVWVREVEGDFGNRREIIDLTGIQLLDYLELYKKFAQSMQADSFRESYKLDSIANHELKTGKTTYTGTLDDLYKNNFERFIDYNINDVDLVIKLDEKLKFIEQVITLALDAKINFSDAFTTVRMWDAITHNYLMDKGIVVPFLNVSGEHYQIEGAYVKDPQIGVHNWVVSFDVNSLYPHLIMQYQISPDCLVGVEEKYANKVEFGVTQITDSVTMFLNGDLETSGLRNDLVAKNHTITPTGCVFDRSRKGFLSELMEKIYNDRIKYKKLMIEAKKKYEETKTFEIEKEIARNKNMDTCKKIQLNSGYGALANKYFRWYSHWLAESVTKSGQLTLRWIERDFNKYLNKALGTVNKDYVLAGDSVLGDTPVVIRKNGLIEIVPISTLSSGQIRYAVSDTYVLTENGFSKIKYVYRHKVKKNGYRILTRKGYIRCTEDHSLIVAGQEVTPKDLKVGDVVELVDVSLNNNTVIDKELAWLFGFFLAEGSCGRYGYEDNVVKYSWALNNQDTTLLKKSRNILLRCLGLNTVILDTIKSSNVYKLVPKGNGKNGTIKIFVDYFRFHCYRGEFKIIPVVVLNGTEEVKRSFVDGMVCGDGHISRDGILLDQKNHSIISGVAMILKELGIEYSLGIRHDKPNICRIRWNVVNDTNSKKPWCLRNKKESNVIKKNRKILH